MNHHFKMKKNQPKKYKNKYRPSSIRLQNWNYGWGGLYFITICTKNKECFFGKIFDGEMILSGAGLNARKFWFEIPDRFSYAKLEAFVVMPNHIHGIIVIDNNFNPSSTPNTTLNTGSNNNDLDAINRVSTGGVTELHNPMLHNNLSRIVRWYKGRTTVETRKTDSKFSWQPRFWDHIIRDEDAYHQISEYIINNPIKWEKDKLNGGSGNHVMEVTSEYNIKIWMT